MKRATEQLAERTEALKHELATQKDEYSQRLFEAQQENNQVCIKCCSNDLALVSAVGALQ